ncbi:hypothetical protein IV500_15265 [Paeniglutamicibacter antarcticus]|uniref:Uncharacterized protein n=1 Tax=Arthrobacter terrae TaxID=2935737 RepID=A0A931CM15_9MICC|nr:hypothetical protein [Arthrobacter terrae]MBG0740733.1 hypothetical protein [Arthrobacter terrae]
MWGLKKNGTAVDLATKATQMLIDSKGINSLEKVLLRDVPFREALDQFEDIPWREQQMIMSRVRMQEEMVSLKHLPIAMGIFTIFVGGGVTWLIRMPHLSAGLLSISMMVAAVVLGVILVGMRISRRRDSRLFAWAEALTASHGRKTKEQDELIKQRNAPQPAATRQPDESASAPDPVGTNRFASGAKCFQKLSWGKA